MDIIYIHINQLYHRVLPCLWTPLPRPLRFRIRNIFPRLKAWQFEARPCDPRGLDDWMLLFSPTIIKHFCHCYMTELYHPASSYTSYDLGYCLCMFSRVLTMTISFLQKKTSGRLHLASTWRPPKGRALQGRGLLRPCVSERRLRKVCKAYPGYHYDSVIWFCAVFFDLFMMILFFDLCYIYIYIYS